MIYLDYGDLLHIARRALGGEPSVRDQGLLESALARPQAAPFGREAYPSLEEKAAALTHSLVKNHGLFDGNKRLGLAALIAFLGMNGWRLSWTNDEAYDVIIAIADGRLDEIEGIAERIRQGSIAR